MHFQDFLMQFKSHSSWKINSLPLECLLFSVIGYIILDCACQSRHGATFEVDFAALDVSVMMLVGSDDLWLMWLQTMKEACCSPHSYISSCVKGDTKISRNICTWPDLSQTQDCIISNKFSLFPDSEIITWGKILITVLSKNLFKDWSVIHAYL